MPKRRVRINYYSILLYFLYWRLRGSAIDQEIGGNKYKLP